MKQKIFDKYHGKIVNHTLGERDIISLRSQLNGMRTQSAPVRLASGRIGDAHVTLLRSVELCMPRICADQAQKGLDWLLSQWRTPAGRERKHNPFGVSHQAILFGFSHFTLVELRDLSTSSFGLSQGYHNYAPVYRVHATDGRTFDYVSGCWQSGQYMQVSNVRVAT